MLAGVSPWLAGTRGDSAPPRLARSMAAINREPALAQTVREKHFHLLRFSIRHGIEMLVQTRDEPLAAPFDDARRLDAVLVILKALLGREAGHADVVARLAVALRIAEVDDIDVVMTGSVSRLWRARQVPCPTSPVARRDAGTATGSSHRRR